MVVRLAMQNQTWQNNLFVNMHSFILEFIHVHAFIIMDVGFYMSSPILRWVGGLIAHF